MEGLVETGSQRVILGQQQMVVSEETRKVERSRRGMRSVQ